MRRLRKALCLGLAICLAAWGAATALAEPARPLGGTQALEISHLPPDMVAVAGERAGFVDPRDGRIQVMDMRSWNQWTLEQAETWELGLWHEYTAYIAFDGEQYRLHVQNLVTDERYTLSEGWQTRPIMAAGKLVWAGGAEEPHTLYLHDIATRTTREVARVPFEALVNWRNYFTWKSPLLFDGRWLVWSEAQDRTDSAIIVIDTETGERAEYVAEGPDRHTYATGLDGGRLVYMDWEYDTKAEAWHLWIGLQDLAAGPAGGARRIGSIPGPGPASLDRYIVVDPVIKGDRIGWVTWDDAGQYDLLLLDLRTETTRLLTNDGGVKENVLLGDRYAFYQEVSAEGVSGRVLAVPIHPLPPGKVLTHPGEVPPVSFADLNRQHWATPSIDLVAAAGLMRGDTGGTFRPDATTRRAELLATLMRAYPQDGPLGEPFADVPADHWAYELIHRARALGLVTGFENRFEPDRAVTRAEMAVMLQRFLQLPPPVSPLEFPDMEAPELAWARPAVSTLAANDLLRGYPGGLFNPYGTATRAELATVLSRLFQPE